MQPTKTKKEWEEEFKKIYIDILKRSKGYDELIAENESNLTLFKSEHTLDNNSIEFLPAYFNFIECFLAQGEKKLGEVKKYLIVGLTNLLNSSKKGEDKGYSDKNITEYEPEEVNRKLLQSRLDLLFSRYNLQSHGDNNQQSQAITKLTSSIIAYSEIYGPENVGLTPQYYYLAQYFIDNANPEDKIKKVIVKKIYSKIADLWRLYFKGMINPLFLYNDDSKLLFAIGETYVKLISNKIASEFPRNSECELDLKFRMIKVIILKKTKSDFYPQALNNVLDFQSKIQSQIIDKDYINEMNEIMKNDEQ